MGKKTLHGTVVVVWQKGDKGAENINSPIEIPKKASRVRIQVDYLQEPKINPKAVRFDECNLNENKYLLREYNVQRQTWTLACYLSNTKQEGEWKGNELNSLQVFGTVENTQCSDLPGNLELDAGESEETVIKILKSNSSICSNNDKADVMPTSFGSHQIFNHGKSASLANE